MPISFKNEQTARNQGWKFESNFSEIPKVSGKKKYSVLAEKELSSIERAFRRVIFYFLTAISCGCALKNKNVIQWKKEIDEGKICARIFLKEINSKADWQQPVIISDDWGQIAIEVNGISLAMRDAVITPNSAVNWDWNWESQNQMRHHPGIRRIDIDRFILSSQPVPDAVILSQGRGPGGGKENPGPGILEVNPDLRSYLLSRGVKEVHILKTAPAIKRYRELCSQGGKRVAAMIHTTC